GVITDTGRKRRRNEDAYVCEPPLFAIADGMGGAQAGEVASRLAASALKESGAKTLGGERRISDLIQEANRRVYDRSSTDPNTSGMGTTITVALVENGNVAFGHVGDSRAYLIRDGRMEQVTEDHSLVNELMKSGKLSREEAETHPQRSVITRALGTDPDVDADTFTIEAKAGDVFLLCSDGLTDMVGEREIQELVERNRENLDAALKSLVKAANRGGGEDNITVVAFEIAEEQALTHDGETRENVLPAPPGGDDEDTLTEVDAVPVVDTAVVSVEEIQTEVIAKEHRDRAVRRRHLRRRVLAWLVLIAIAAGIALALYLRFVR
ncbi:MAG TPA: Stp1/IreP family PP2C-type Ser/Thr phosphatase, partial [Candidatus Limnocylindria bacterium]